MNKNKLTLLSLAGTVFFLLGMIVSIFGLCSINSDFFCSRPHESMYASFFLLFFPLFLFSLITYKIKESAYLAWYNFVKLWIPLSLLVIVITPRYSHDWIFPIDKGRVAIFVTSIFTITSITLIAYKSYKLRGK